MKTTLSLNLNRAQRCAVESKMNQSHIALLTRICFEKRVRIVVGTNQPKNNFVRSAKHNYSLHALLHAVALLLSLFACLNVSAVEKYPYWKVDADGNWTNVNNWSALTVPDNSGTNTYSPIMDMQSRTITLDRDVTIESFSLSRGGVFGTNMPTMMLHQQLTFGAAKITGEGLLSANGMIVTGATKIVHGWTLENRGVANWLEGDFHFGGGSRFRNTSTAGFNANFDGTMSVDVSGGAIFENAGMFRKSAGTGQTKFYIPFVNTGNVEIDSGELAFYTYSTNYGGSTEILPGAALTFTGARHVYDAASKIYGTGKIDFDNGTVDFDGAMNVTGPVEIRIATVNMTPTCTVTQLGNSLLFSGSGTLNLNSGEPIAWNSLTMSNGTLNSSDAIKIRDGGFLWMSGTLIGSAHLDVTNASMAGNGTKTLRGWTVENHGAFDWSGGSVSTGEGSRFVNLSGSSLQTGFDGNWSIGHGGGSFFDNFGVVQKTAGTNYTYFGVPFYNEGLIESVGGAIRFGNSLTNKGALAMHDGASFIFQSANIQLTAIGSLDGDGSVVLDVGSVANYGSFRAASGVTLNSGTMKFSTTTSRPNLGSAIRFTGLSTLDLSSGYTIGVPAIFQTNGTIAGSDMLVISNQWFCNNGDLDGSGAVELRGNSFIYGGPRWTGRRVTNYGEFTWVSGDIDAGLGLVFDNALGGTVNLGCDRILSASYGGTTAFINHGIVRKDPGTGTNNTGTTTFVLPFTNNNVVVVNSGRLQFNGGYTQNGGLLALNGTAVGSSKTLMIGGTFAGTGTVFGTISNLALVAPGWSGTIGQLNISGSYTQAPSGSIQIEIGGTNQFDVLAVTNVANLNGALEIGLLNGFVPQDGTTFPVLTCASRVGQFAQITGGDLPNGRKLVPVYSATGVSLTVSNTLPPLRLSIEPVTGTNAVKVSWTDGYPDYTLQSCTNLCGTNWSSLTSTTNSVLIPAELPAQFFRLMKTN